MQAAQGELAATLTSYQAALAIRERLAKADPGNAGWQRDLAVLRNKIGDVKVAQGELTAALTSYQAALVIAEVWRKRTRAMPAGSATTRSPTIRSAMSGWRRASSRRH